MSETLAAKTYALFDRPANRKLAAELETAGKLIRLPEVTAARTADFDAAVDPFAFDWLIFTDPMAADFFLEKIGGDGTDFYELDAVRICALGEAVSDRLRFAQVHADIIPQRLDTGTVLSLLANYVSSADLSGVRFLLVREKSSTGELAEALRRSGAAVTEFSPYEFRYAETGNLPRLKTLIKGGAADEFVFTQPFEATALEFLFGEQPSRLLSETQISAADEITFQTLREHGLRPLYFTRRAGKNLSPPPASAGG